jgi:hypothetical protein
LHGKRSIRAKPGTASVFISFETEFFRSANPTGNYTIETHKPKQLNRRADFASKQEIPSISLS